MLILGIGGVERYGLLIAFGSLFIIAQHEVISADQIPCRGIFLGQRRQELERALIVGVAIELCRLIERRRAPQRHRKETTYNPQSPPHNNSWRSKTFLLLYPMLQMITN